MSSLIELKLRTLMRELGWNQTELADHLGVTQATVSRWFKGSDPSGETREKINELYMGYIGALDDAQAAEVPLMGYIGAGAEIMPEYEQVPPEGLDQITVPFTLPAEMIAFEVRGDSMLPVYKDGAIVVVYKEQRRPLEAFFGEDAAVRTTDGRRFIKTIMRGLSGVNLMSWNAAPIENVGLEWIGEIFAVLPRNSIRHVQKSGGIQGRLRFGT